MPSLFSWLRTSWHALWARYWALPAVMGLSSAALAWLSIRLDGLVQAHGLALSALVYPGGPEGARIVLSTVAASALGIAGVSFSVTIVALSLASSQMGPRLLQGFLRDRGNQLVLGTFIATFLYDLLVLGAVRAEAVPRLSVTFGLVLGTASVGVLVWFVHHVATSIQADRVVAAVAGDLLDSIERLSGTVPDAPEHEPPPAAAAPEEAVAVAAPRSGYLRAIHVPRLVARAKEHDLVVQALHRPGDFVVAGEALGRAWPAERVPEDFADAVRPAFAMGALRTGEQDLEFAVRQLVEVALRALSPGVQDPYTAMACLDWIGASLARLGERGLPPPWRRDDEGRVRVLLDAPDMAGVVDAALQQIRQAAADDLAVVLRLLETIARVAPHLPEGGGREALRYQARAAWRDMARRLPDGADRRALDRRRERALRALEAPPRHREASRPD